MHAKSGDLTIVRRLFSLPPQSWCHHFPCLAPHTGTLASSDCNDNVSLTMPKPPHHPSQMITNSHQWRSQGGGCWYFQTSTEVNPQAYGITIVAFTRKYLGIVFPQGTEVFLLANSSKDNIRVELERVEMDSYGFWV
jgi:hypothetical protein